MSPTSQNGRPTSLLLLFAFVASCASGKMNPSDGGSTGADTVGGTIFSEISDSGFGDSTCNELGCDDQLPCTEDQCIDGSCTHQLKEGYCLIDGACYDDGEKESGQSCNLCDAKTASTSWTPQATLCPDDGLSCTTATCTSGTCTTQLQSGFCLVNGACIKGGDGGDDCLLCDPSISTTTLQPAKDGTACSPDKLGCTEDHCIAGACSHPIITGHCLIGGTCYQSGALHPSGACSFCKPGASQSSWTSITYQGCCEGGMVWYCDGGALSYLDCLFNPSCGWNSSSQYYDCGTVGSAEPSGVHAKSCL